jgi:hypothetical protein
MDKLWKGLGFQVFIHVSRIAKENTPQQYFEGGLASVVSVLKICPKLHAKLLYKKIHIPEFLSCFWNPMEDLAVLMLACETVTSNLDQVQRFDGSNPCT